MKYKDIRTRDQLLTRLTKQEGIDLPLLSVGNQYKYIKHLLHRSPPNPQAKKVLVRYAVPANVIGTNEIVRYI